MRKLSIVLPCYNEQEVIGTTLQRVSAIAAKLADWNLEILVIDDGSSDSTAEIVAEFDLPEGVSLTLLRFTRNFGHQAAIFAGLLEASGDAVAILDSDLQDPPELILEMLPSIDQGFHVVSARRRTRQGTEAWKKIAYKAYYRFLARIVSDIEIPVDTGDFRILSREAVDHLRALPENALFLRGLIPYLGLASTHIEYERQPREAGSPKYTLRKLTKLALDGVVSFTTRPLQIASIIGLLMFALAVIGVALVFIIRLGTNEWVPGWAGTMIVLLSFGGLQFLFLGILGEYVGRIFHEVKGRPMFVVHSVKNVSGPRAQDSIKTRQK